MEEKERKMSQYLSFFIFAIAHAPDLWYNVM